MGRIKDNPELFWQLWDSIDLDHLDPFNNKEDKAKIIAHFGDFVKDGPPRRATTAQEEHTWHKELAERVKQLASLGYQPVAIAKKIGKADYVVRQVIHEEHIKIYKHYTVKIKRDGREAYFENTTAAAKDVGVTWNTVEKYADTYKPYKGMYFYTGEWNEKDVG